VAEAIQGALSQQRLIKDRHPFFNASIRRHDCGSPRVPLNEQVVEIRGGLAGKLLESEIIDDQQIRTDEAAQFAVEGVIGARAGQSFQEQIGADEEHAVAGAAGRVADGLSQEGFSDTDRAKPIMLTFQLTSLCITGGIPCSAEPCA